MAEETRILIIIGLTNIIMIIGAIFKFVILKKKN